MKNPHMWLMILILCSNDCILRLSLLLINMGNITTSLLCTKPPARDKK